MLAAWRLRDTACVAEVAWTEEEVVVGIDEHCLAMLRAEVKILRCLFGAWRQRGETWVWWDGGGNGNTEIEEVVRYKNGSRNEQIVGEVEAGKYRWKDEDFAT